MINESLSEIKKFLSRAKYDEALQIVEQLEKREELTPEDNLTCQLLKSHIHTEIGDFEKGLQLAEAAITESRRLGNSLKKVDAYIAKVEALNSIGKLDMAQKIIDQSEQLLSTLEGEPLAALNQRKAALLLVTITHILPSLRL